jgi:alpha-tubulin suppressor-like RCC1 family protein
MSDHSTHLVKEKNMKKYLLPSAIGVLALAAYIACGGSSDKKPEITKQPQALALATIGQTATFSVEAKAKPDPEYQWEVSYSGEGWEDIPNAKSATFTTQPLANSGTFQYRVKITSKKNELLSNPTTLKVFGHTTFTPGFLHVLAIRNDGTLWAWGEGFRGKLGTGNTTSQRAPFQAGTDTDWVSVAAGEDHSVALKSNGQLWAWGDNEYGQLGNGQPFAGTNHPARIGTDSDWVAVDANDFFTVALKANGQIWAWGLNEDGVLGNGSADEFEIAEVPVRVGTASDWAAVYAGHYHVMALKKNGELWAWGYNGYGNLGDGTDIDRLTPTRIGTASDWVSVKGGEFHTLALKANGELWTWGRNNVGQLGLGDNDDKLTPTRVGTASDWRAIGNGYNHSYAVKTNGTLYAWGRNDHGQLGDGTIINKNTPDQVGADTNWAFVDGMQFTLALKTNGELWAWGRNNQGQVGRGNTTTPQPTPQVVNGGHTFRLP